ncbi:MAG: hypothetical protein LBR66_02875 [Candidatus Symbiothrix sp.]|jgi:hypothetical protein|nr:hypothetical protein [Candidatus Symbiothrix sp.]
MKNLILTLIIIVSVIGTTRAQSSKILYEYNKFIDLKGTEFTVATSEHRPKMGKVRSNLLFINTLTGTIKEIDFVEGSRLSTVQQVKIDSLGINIVLVVANTIDLDNKKDIDWDDPRQILVFSPSGNDMQQLTEDNYYVNVWSINEFTGTLIVSGFFDINRNRKKDKSESNEILLFDLKTRRLKKKL